MNQNDRSWYDNGWKDGRSDYRKTEGRVCYRKGILLGLVIATLLYAFTETLQWILNQ